MSTDPVFGGIRVSVRSSAPRTPSARSSLEVVGAGPTTIAEPAYRDASSRSGKPTKRPDESFIPKPSMTPATQPQGGEVESVPTPQGRNVSVSWAGLRSCRAERAQPAQWSHNESDCVGVTPRTARATGQPVVLLELGLTTLDRPDRACARPVAVNHQPARAYGFHGFKVATEAWVTGRLPATCALGNRQCQCARPRTSPDSSPQ